MVLFVDLHIINTLFGLALTAKRRAGATVENVINFVPIAIFFVVLVDFLVKDVFHRVPGIVFVDFRPVFPRLYRHTVIRGLKVKALVLVQEVLFRKHWDMFQAGLGASEQLKSKGITIVYDVRCDDRIELVEGSIVLLQLEFVWVGKQQD